MIGDVQIRWLRDAARVAITERSEYQAAQARTVQTRRERAFAAERLDRAARDAAWAWAWSLSRPQCSLERAAIEDESAMTADVKARAEAIRQANRVFRARALRDDIASAMQRSVSEVKA